MPDGKTLTIQELSHLVGCLHDSFADGAAWNEFLARSAEALGACSAMVTSIAPTRQTGLWIPYRVDDVVQRRFEQYYRNISPIRANLRLPAPGHAEVVRSSEIVPDSAMQQTEFYQEFWRPLDWRWFQAITITPDSLQPLHYMVAYLRPSRSPDFERTLDPVFEAFGYHLSRIERLVRTRSLVRETMYSANGGAGFFLTAEGRLLETNEKGAELMAMGAARSGPRSLQLGSQAADLWLQGIISSVSRTVADSRGLRLRATDPNAGELMYELRVLTDPPPSPSLRGARFVLVANTPNTPDRQESARHASRLFGWTQAEFDVSSRLAAGATLTDIAAARSSSLATVRSHLKRAKHKAGVRRQVELVRLVLKLEDGELEP